MNIIINMCRAVLNILYFFMKLRPVKKKVVFLSRQSNEPSIDIIELKREIERQHPEYETLVLCRKIGDGLSGKILYCFHILKQMWNLSNAEIVILDSYCISLSLLKQRSSLLVIQMWHSVGTMKKFAYSILDKPEGSSARLAHAMRMHKGYDFIFCAGEGYRAHVAEGFNYPENKIVVFPLPRVELLQRKSHADEMQENIFHAYPELTKKKNVLYVPTFRKGELEKAEFNQALSNLKVEFSLCSDKFNLIVKPHPLSGVKDEYDKFSSFDFLFVADYVISDYSCIIYEAAIRHIPLFFYAYDYDQYIAERDIYMDYPSEIPGKMYTKASEIVSAIKGNKFDAEKQELFLKKYVDYTMTDIVSSTINFIFTHRKC